MMDETFVLVSLVIVMLVGSYMAGMIPLVMRLSEVSTKNYILIRILLIGDQGYFLELWLLTSVGAPNASKQQKYNIIHGFSIFFGQSGILIRI